MAARISLRDYQRELAARLRRAESGSPTSRLAIQAGEDGWLVDLRDAGEVIQVPPLTPVPLARPWFRGVANVRGNLYGVADFSAFLGGAPTALSEQSRLLLIGEQFRSGAALLVARSLGLRNPAQLQLRPLRDAAARWTKAEYTDADGRLWKELNVPLLVQHPEFMKVAA